MFTVTDTLILALAALAAVQVCLCDPATETGTGGGDPLLTREDIAKLSGIRVQARSESVKTRCALYANALRELVPVGLPEGATEIDLINRIIGELRQRKLPFNNPQPVLEDLQECVAHRELLEQQTDEQSSPRRQVIAGPPTKEGPSPRDEHPVERILDEHEAVRQKTVDRGQDIYYKPDSEGQTIEEQLERLDAVAADHQGESVLDEPEVEHPEEEPRESSADKIQLLMSENQDLENSLRSRESELDLVKAEVANLKRIVATGRQTQAQSSQENLNRARFEEMKRLYEAALGREANMKRTIDEISKRNEPVEDKKDDKKRVKDPAEQAAILYDKLSAQDEPEDRCYKYYLLFSYPDKVVKKTIKTIAKIQVNLQGMDAFYSLVNPAFSSTLEGVLDRLAASKKKDSLRAAAEFEQCLRGLSSYHDEQSRQLQDPNVHEIPIDFYPSRRRAENQFEDGDAYRKPASSGRLNGGGASVATAAAATTTTGGYGGSDFVEFLPLDPASISYENYYFGRNPYV